MIIALKEYSTRRSELGLMIIDYKSFDIGLNRDQLVLMPHSSKWADIYLQESLRVTQAMNSNLPELKLHHIGSTAIKGMVAKPILDMLGEVGEITDLDQFKQIFENLGYEYKGEYGIPGRRYLTLYNDDKSMTFVHLHFFKSGSERFKQHLAFNNILSEQKGLREEYAALKESLVQGKIARSEYSNAKSALILRILSTSHKLTP